MIFCHNCSNNQAPLPEEQLMNPVRVCDDCIRQIESKESASSSAEDQDIEEHRGTNDDNKVTEDTVEAAQEAVIELAPTTNKIV